MSAIADRGYRHPDALVSTEWVAAHANDPNVRIIESNEDTLLYAVRPRPRRGARRLDRRPQRPAAPRLHRARRLREADGEDRRHPRHHRRLLRRQEQLVGLLRLLGVPALRPHQGARHGRRPAEVAEGRARLVHRHAELPGDDLQGARARRRQEPDPARRGHPVPEEGRPVRRRAQPRGVHRHAHAHARVSERGRDPRRPHSRAPRASRGPRRSTPTTAPSRPPTS